MWIAPNDEAVVRQALLRFVSLCVTRTDNKRTLNVWVSKVQRLQQMGFITTKNIQGFSFPQVTSLY